MQYLSELKWDVGTSIVSSPLFGHGLCPHFNTLRVQRGLEQLISFRCKSLSAIVSAFQLLVSQEAK
jgi:hypothetical protein